MMITSQVITVLELAIALARRYLPFILGGLLIGGLLWYLHHKIYESGRDDERAEWVKRDAETGRKSQELLKLKKHEADMINQQNQERANNAIQIYANHYDELRAAADAIPERVYISTKTNCSGDTMPRASESRSATKEGTGRIGKAELSSENIRELNKTISMIEDMQLKCERLLNTVE